MTTQPPTVGPRFIPEWRYASMRSEPGVVQVLYRAEIGIPQQYTGGVWQISPFPSRAALVREIVSALAKLDGSDVRPLVLNVESNLSAGKTISAADAAALDTLCLDLCRWMFPGRACALIGRDHPGAGTVYPMLYGPTHIGPGVLPGIYKASGGKRIVPLIWNKQATGRNVGQPLSAKDEARLDDSLAAHIVTTDGQCLVLGWSDATTAQEKKKYLAWLAAREASVLWRVAKIHAAMPAEPSPE